MTAPERTLGATQRESRLRLKPFLAHEQHAKAQLARGLLQTRLAALELRRAQRRDLSELALRCSQRQRQGVRDVARGTRAGATDARGDHGLSTLHCVTARAGFQPRTQPSGSALSMLMRRSSPP